MARGSQEARLPPDIEIGYKAPMIDELDTGAADLRENHEVLGELDSSLLEDKNKSTVNHPYHYHY